MFLNRSQFLYLTGKTNDGMKNDVRRNAVPIQREPGESDRGRSNYTAYEAFKTLLSVQLAERTGLTIVEASRAVVMGHQAVQHVYLEAKAGRSEQGHFGAVKTYGGAVLSAAGDIAAGDIWVRGDDVETLEGVKLASIVSRVASIQLIDLPSVGQKFLERLEELSLNWAEVY